MAHSEKARGHPGTQFAQIVQLCPVANTLQAFFPCLVVIAQASFTMVLGSREEYRFPARSDHGKMREGTL